MALKNAMHSLNLQNEALLGFLLQIYDNPTSFRDVPKALADLKSRNIKSFILSNGTRAMLDNGVHNAGIGEFIVDWISADEIERTNPLGQFMNMD